MPRVTEASHPCYVLADREITQSLIYSSLMLAGRLTTGNSL